MNTARICRLLALGAASLCLCACTAMSLGVGTHGAGIGFHSGSDYDYAPYAGGYVGRGWHGTGAGLGISAPLPYTQPYERGTVVYPQANGETAGQIPPPPGMPTPAQPVPNQRKTMVAPQPEAQGIQPPPLVIPPQAGAATAGMR